MGDTKAEHKRALLPFLQRAEEVQKVEPKVAYYCRLYAVEEGLKLQNREKVIDELLFSVMDKLEQFKRSNQLNAEDDKLYLEGFALKIFNRADKVDIAGKANMSTCKAFYAASVFMEVCKLMHTWVWNVANWRQLKTQTLILRLVHWQCSR